MATIKLTGRVFFEENVWLVELPEIGQMTQADSREHAQDEAELLAREYFWACQKVGHEGRPIQHVLDRFGLTADGPEPVIEVTLTYEDPART